MCFFFQAEDGIRDLTVTGVQTCALPILLPRIAREKLAEYCDIFCERDYFDVEDAHRILTAAKQHGLKLRMHVDQLTNSGGDRKSTRLNSSHSQISYAVFCLKTKKKNRSK